MARALEVRQLTDAPVDVDGFGDGPTRVPWDEVRRIGYVLDQPSPSADLEFLVFQTTDPSRAIWVDTHGFARQAPFWREVERRYGLLRVPEIDRAAEPALHHVTLWPREEAGEPMYDRARRWLRPGPELGHRPVPARHRPTLLPWAQLSREELAAAPVWVRCHDVDRGQPWYADTDEETYRPWRGSWPVSTSERLVVAAEIELASGAKYPGFVTPTVDDIGLRKPHVFIPSGATLALWLGCSGKPDTASLRELDSVDGPVFPLRYRVDRGVCTEPIEGEVDGFYKMVNDANVRIGPD